MFLYSQSQIWFNESTLKRSFKIIAIFIMLLNFILQDKPSQIYFKYSIYCPGLRQTCIHTLCAEPHSTVRWKHKWDIRLPLCPFWLQWSASADLISYSLWQRCSPWMPPIVLTATTRRERMTPSKSYTTACSGGLPVKCDDSWIL